MTYKQSLSRLEARLNLPLMFVFLVNALFFFAYEKGAIVAYNQTLPDSEQLSAGLSLGFGTVFVLIGTLGLAAVSAVLLVTALMLLRGKGMQVSSVVALIAKIIACPLYILQTALHHTLASKILFLAGGLYLLLTIVMGIVCLAKRASRQDTAAPLEAEFSETEAT